MNSISKFQSLTNIGGLQLIQFCPVEDVVSIPSPSSSNIVIGPVLFKEGAGWLDLYCTEGTMVFSFTEKETDNGTLFDMEVEGNCPQINQEVDIKLIQSSVYKYILRIKDNNGYWRILGRKTQGLQLIKKGTTGSSAASKNGIQLLFSYSYPTIAPYYRDNVLIWSVAEFNDPSFYSD